MVRPRMVGPDRTTLERGLIQLYRTTLEGRHYTSTDSVLTQLSTCDSTAGVMTMTLPPARQAGYGDVRCVFRVAGASNVTVAVVAGDANVGASSLVMTSNGDFLMFVSDGTTNWLCIGGRIAGAAI